MRANEDARWMNTYKATRGNLISLPQDALSYADILPVRMEQILEVLQVVLVGNQMPSAAQLAKQLGVNQFNVMELLHWLKLHNPEYRVEAMKPKEERRVEFRAMVADLPTDGKVPQVLWDSIRRLQRPTPGATYVPCINTPSHEAAVDDSKEQMKDRHIGDYYTGGVDQETNAVPQQLIRESAFSKLAEELRAESMRSASVVPPRPLEPRVIIPHGDFGGRLNWWSEPSSWRQTYYYVLPWGLGAPESGDRTSDDYISLKRWAKHVMVLVNPPRG
jgi:hypothetical protein